MKKFLNSFFASKKPRFIKKPGLLYNILVKEVLYMPYFTMEKVFLFPSFDIPLKEKEKMVTFLKILELSGVGKIIGEATKKDYAGGRRSYNPYRLFATIIYAFSKHSGSVRKIEESLKL